jgi:hypothetical protein
VKKVALWVAIGIGVWCVFRWRAASDMHVPLDLAFKHPLIPVDSLYDVVSGIAVIRGGEVVRK